MNLKVSIIVLIWITIPLSAIFLIQLIYVRLTLFAIALTVSVMIWRQPTARQTSREIGNVDAVK